MKNGRLDVFIRHDSASTGVSVHEVNSQRNADGLIKDIKGFY
jgi:hypothetical protein